MDENSKEQGNQGARGEQYYRVGELMGMSVDQLQALWDEIPPDRQAFYESAYSAALESLGPGDVSDDAAMGIIEQILSHYDSGQVPILSENRWVQVPSWVREKVENGEDLSRQEPTAAEVKNKRTSRASGPSRAAGPSLPLIIAGVGAVFIFVCVAIMLIQRLTGGSKLTAEQSTGTAVAELTAQPTGTVTNIPITGADQIIRSGQDFKGYYPVILELKPKSGTQHLYVVQQRPVKVADWQFEGNNPDVASWVSGLLVRPVLGIPYTDENAKLLGSLQPEDTILLHMSTGTGLQFQVSRLARINPQDTDIFRQVTPGIALVLLGDTGASDRLAVFGDYLPNQEVVGEDQALNIGNSSVPQIPVGESAPIDGASGTVTALKGYSSLGGNELPPDLAYLFVDVTVSAGDKPIDTSTLQYNLVDSLGNRYSTVSFNTTFADNPPFTGQQVEAKGNLTGTVGFLVPRTISPTGQFNVTVNPGGQTVAYKLTYDTPQSLAQLPAQVQVSTVEIHRAAGKPDRVFVRATITNPNQQALAVHQPDFYAVFSVNDPGQTFPAGAQVLPISVNGSSQMEAKIDPGQSVQIEAEFNWDKSPFVGFFILGYQFIVKLS